MNKTYDATVAGVTVPTDSDVSSEASTSSGRRASASNVTA